MAPTGPRRRAIEAKLIHAALRKLAASLVLASLPLLCEWPGVVYKGLRLCLTKRSGRDPGRLPMRRSHVAAIVLSAFWAVSAEAGQYVDRLDDGTVLLKLGPAYENAVIETTQEELGSVLGASGTPFAGTKVRVLSHDEGPHGPISGPLEAFAP